MIFIQMKNYLIVKQLSLKKLTLLFIYIKISKSFFFNSLYFNLSIVIAFKILELSFIISS